jgi:glucose dehydrogenase
MRSISIMTAAFSGNTSDGKIFLYQADAPLVALDAKTGAPVWSVKNGDPSKGATGTSAPLVVKDKVLVGISGGEFGVRGYLTAYDIKDGKRAWRGKDGASRGMQ